VIANTGDDIEIYGAHVSPDPTSCTFWLADRIDERGWGLRDDTFHVMDAAARARRRRVVQPRRPRPRDRLRRARRLARGRALTEALGELGAALGSRRAVLPMSDAPVRTWVRRGAVAPFQEFMIRERGEGPVDGVELRGVEAPSRRRGARGDRGARRDRHRPVEPGDLDRPDPRRARACATRCAPRRAPVVARLAARRRRGRQGPDRGVHCVGRVRAERRGDRGYYGDVLDGMVADERRGSAAAPGHRTR
jgi:LPPG:FO 2-phospho-L-lactate transferase